MNVTNNFTAVSITQGPVTAWVKTFFTPADNGNSYTTSDITDTLESGDWIVITKFEGVGTEADPYVVYFGVVENTYENATTAIDGIVRLSGSTSTATTGNNVVTDTVINALVGDTSTKIGRGDYAKAGYDHSIITNGTNPHNTTFANVASKPTTIGGFGITDAYTKTQSDLRRNYIRNIFPLLQPSPYNINSDTYTPTIYLSSNFPLPAPNVLIPGGQGNFIVVDDDDELTDISLGLWFWDGTQWILLPGGEEPFAINFLYSVSFTLSPGNYDFKCFYQLESGSSILEQPVFRRMDNRILSKEQFAAVDNQLDRVTNLKEIQVFEVNNESDFPNTISGQYIIADGDIGDGRALWRKINSLSSQSVENWELVSGDGDLNKFIFRKGPNSQFALAESKDLYVYRYNPDTEEEEFVLVSLPDEILKDVNIVNAEEPTNVSAVDSKKLSLKGKVLVEQTTPVQVNLAGTSLPHDLVFGNNGTRLYVVDSSTDLIYQYNLATAFLPTSAELLNPSQTFNVSVQDASPLGIDIKPDGTAIFVMGSTNRRVIRYNLSTPFNLSTATFDSWSNQIANSGETLSSVRFKPDGTRFYVLNSTDDTVEVFDLTTPWNVTTNQFLGTFSIATQETTPTGIAFNNDGTKMFIIGSLNDTVYQYNMTSAWGTNATYANKSVLFNENTPNGLTFNADGSRLFVVGSTTDSIKYFDLFTPFDVTSTSKQFKEGYYLKTKNVTTVNATLELGYTLENSADVPIWSIEKNGTVKIPQIKDSTNSVGSNGQALMKVGGTLTWASPQGLTSQTITIGVSDWVANSATKTVTGVTASNIVWISPTATSYLDFSNTQIRATTQGTNSLTFACTTTPTQNVNVVVVIGA
jgi:sugar lactone lactonase YvrE